PPFVVAHPGHRLASTRKQAHACREEIDVVLLAQHHELFDGSRDFAHTQRVTSCLEARIPILKSVQLPFCPSDGPSWRRRARARRLTWLGRPHVEEKPRMLAPASLAGVSPAIFLRRTRLLDAREAEAGVEDSVQVLRQRPVEAGYGEFGGIGR